MDLFQMLVTINPCEGNLGVAVSAVRAIFTLIQWAIPAVLIIMGTLDMFKAMTSGDEKKTQEAKKTFIRRLIYAVVAFLIPFIIGLVFQFVGNVLEGADGAGDAKDTLRTFLACWDGEAKSGARCIDENGKAVDYSNEGDCRAYGYRWE